MTQIGNTYARALYDLARDEGISREILDQLKVLQEAFSQNPDFVRLLSTPNLSKEERCEILDNSFSGIVQPYVLNFMKILAERDYARHFGDCCQEYVDLYNRDNDILPVKVVTAVALTEEQSVRLAEKLACITGKTVELNKTVDERCIGGVLLDYDGKRVDDTVRHRLETVHSLLKNTVL